MTSWFVSDLHLDPSTPEISARFLRFLAGPARGARSLYVLGDLFEAWIGDDDPEPSHREVVAALAGLAQSGVLIYVMRGNRDFLIGKRFCEEACVLLLDDPAVVTIGTTRALLSHGDGLCVDDHAYQRLRALVRDEPVRRAFSRLPLEARRRLAAEARAGSREHLAGAAAYITDVNSRAVTVLMRDAGVALLVHGHTHRPAIHRLDADGVAGTRIVLGAWHDDAMILRWDDAGPALMACPC